MGNKDYCTCGVNIEVSKEVGGNCGNHIGRRSTGDINISIGTATSNAICNTSDVVALN